MSFPQLIILEYPSSISTVMLFAFETPSPTKRGSSFPGRGLVLEDLELTQAVEAKGGLAASRQPIFLKAANS